MKKLSWRYHGCKLLLASPRSTTGASCRKEAVRAEGEVVMSRRSETIDLTGEPSYYHQGRASRKKQAAREVRQTCKVSHALQFSATHRHGIPKYVYHFRHSKHGESFGRPTFATQTANNDGIRRHGEHCFGSVHPG